MTIPNLVEFARENHAISQAYRAEAVADAVHALQELVRDGTARAHITISDIPAPEWGEIDAEAHGVAWSGLDRKLELDPVGLVTVEYVIAEEVPS